ncbi:hypothetical protein [Chondromyces crocatus]|uniref:Uncharacterized protein n=1 Tax=Chondromyces crocatus TaxID=52 RepID=A0A0K1EA00_CHOCO|nr:hypothetical protein [Chondromyces crocatus]AKT37690.1 uncharacterized protein CMC5_018320 [Chondromyces crocatus]
MAKLNGLALSSLVAGALVSFAATTVEAAPVVPADHEALMSDLVAALVGVDPSENRNNWAAPNESCAITWASRTSVPSALTRGSCFFTLALREAYPNVTPTRLSQWFGSSNPSAAVYYDHIVEENRFWRLFDPAEVLVGDVLAVKYTTSGNVTVGYTLVVKGIEYQQTFSDGTERYVVEVVDSSNDPHGVHDTRYVSGGPHVAGVGSGFLFLDADPVTGDYKGHSWSLQNQNQSSYYSIATRPIVVGRFDPNR